MEELDIYSPYIGDLHCCMESAKWTKDHLAMQFIGECMRENLPMENNIIIFNTVKKKYVILSIADYEILLKHNHDTTQ